MDTEGTFAFLHIDDLLTALTVNLDAGGHVPGLAAIPAAWPTAPGRQAELQSRWLPRKLQRCKPVSAPWIGFLAWNAALRTASAALGRRRSHPFKLPRPQHGCARLAV